MTVSLRLNDQDTELIRRYAEMKNISVSELVRTAVLERIEDDIDLEAYKRAYAEYEADPVTYTLDEVERELQL